MMRPTVRPERRLSRDEASSLPNRCAEVSKLKRQPELYSATIWMRERIASPEMLPGSDLLPHLICSPPMFSGGGRNEADQHGNA